MLFFTRRGVVILVLSEGRCTWNQRVANVLVVGQWLAATEALGIVRANDGACHVDESFDRQVGKN